MRFFSYCPGVFTYFNEQQEASFRVPRTEAKTRLNDDKCIYHLFLIHSAYVYEDNTALLKSLPDKNLQHITSNLF